MAKLNIGKILERDESIVNPRYSLSYDAVKDISGRSTGIIDAISNGFKVGYIQGMKAAQAEMRKAGAMNG